MVAAATVVCATGGCRAATVVRAVARNAVARAVSAVVKCATATVVRAAVKFAVAARPAELVRRRRHEHVQYRYGNHRAKSRWRIRSAVSRSA